MSRNDVSGRRRTLDFLAKSLRGITRTMTIPSSLHQARLLARVHTDWVKDGSVFSRVGRETELRLDSLRRVLVGSLFRCMGLLNISRQLQIKVQEGPSSIKGGECSKKHALSLSERSIQSWPEPSRREGRSHFHARSVLIVREHGKRARTPLAAFFNIPMLLRTGEMAQQ